MTNITVIYLALFLLFISNLFLFVLYLRQQRFFSTFTHNVTDKNLKSVLVDLEKSYQELDVKTKDNQQAIIKIIKESHHHFQKIGFVRFNPFSDTGGDQSFCLCLLDQDDNGFVITSLHSREQTRMYAKTIIAAHSDQQTFFEEEKKALELAINNH